MSRLGPHDEHLHYEDGSHRWTDPEGVEGDESWRRMVEAHLEAHQSQVNGGGGWWWPGRLRRRRGQGSGDSEGGR